MNDHSPAPLRLLVLASRPSDYTEMSELARALAARRHRPSLVYFYSPTDPGSQGIIRDMAALERASVTAQPVDIDDVYRGGQVVEEDGDTIVRERPSQAAEEGLYNLVLAFRSRVLGQEGTLRLRRYLPTVRRIFPVVYKVARFVDIIRNLPDGVRMARRVWRQRLSQRLTQSRQMTLGMRVRVLIMGPKVVTDAAFMEQLYFRFLRFFRDLIRNADAQALLIPEDIVGNLWPVAIKAGHDAGIPTLVLPYTLANKQEAFQSLKDQPSYQTEANQIAAALYPRWRLIEGGADLVRLPSAHIFAHERLRITPPDPWMMNSGFADAICVDSTASFEYFRAGGIPAEQMRVVGSVSQDQMFERRRDRERHITTLRKDLGLVGEKPILLLSGCPNQLAATVPYCEFTSIGEVADHVGKSVRPLAADYHIIVRPHPNYPEFAEMLRRFDFAPTMMPTASLVPLADLFVAFASATIRWAIACGVPTVNYDVFHYDYADFAAAKGVQTVKGGQEFSDLMRSLRPTTPALAALATTARADSAYWSVMDGRGLERIEEAIWEARKAR